MNMILLLILLQTFISGTDPIDHVDVPAIQEEYGPLGVQFCDASCIFIATDHSLFSGPNAQEPYRQTRYTCTDKTRFLMTSEDGRKHCIKLK